jgi:hypothetical protein
MIHSLTTGEMRVYSMSTGLYTVYCRFKVEIGFDFPSPRN